MRHAKHIVASLMSAAVVAAAAPAIAAGDCGTVGISTVDLNAVRYDPFDNSPLEKIVTFEVSGNPGQTIWLRIATPIGGGVPRVSFEGQTAQSTRDDVSGPSGSNPPATINVLNRNWMRVMLPTSGRTSVVTLLTLSRSADLRAGTYAMNLDMRIACQGASPGSFVEDMPVAIADASVKVPALLGLANLSRNRIDLGVLPIDNQEGWSGNNTAETTLNVQSTGDFSIRVTNNQLILNHVGSSGPRTPATQIPYDLMIGGVKLLGVAGERREVGCVADQTLQPSERQRIPIKPVFPANSALGKLAGNYRDVITLEVSSRDLAAATGEPNCS